MKKSWTPKTRIIGIDLGYTQGKLDAFELQDTVVIPSLAQLDPRTEATFIESNDGHRIDLKKHGKDHGRVFLVGKRGEFDLNARRFDGSSESTDYAKYFTLLSLYLNEVNFRDIDLVVTGLPTEQVQDYGKFMMEKMTGNFVFDFEGRGFDTNVNKVWVLPQCMGAFYDYILDDQGRIKPNEMEQARHRVLAINLGGKTFEVGIIEDGKYTDQSYTIKIGATKVHDELNKILRAKGMNTFTALDLDRIVRTGEHPYNRSSLEEEVIAAAQIVFQQMVAGMNRHEITTDLNMFSAVLLSGGGSNIFAPFFEGGLPPHLRENLFISDDPEGANAKGFRKFGYFNLRRMGKLQEENDPSLEVAAGKE